jgi:hypothetical protein
VVVKLGTAVFDAPAPALIKLRQHGQVYGAGSDHEGDGEQRGPHGIGSSLARARAGSLVQASDAQRKQVLWDVCFVAFFGFAVETFRKAAPTSALRQKARRETSPGPRSRRGCRQRVVAIRTTPRCRRHRLHAQRKPGPNGASRLRIAAATFSTRARAFSAPPIRWRRSHTARSCVNPTPADAEHEGEPPDLAPSFHNQHHVRGSSIRA